MILKYSPILFIVMLSLCDQLAANELNPILKSDQNLSKDDKKETETTKNIPKKVQYFLEGIIDDIVEFGIDNNLIDKNK